MNKKSFMRTLEVFMAVLLLVGFFNWMSAKSHEASEELKRNPCSMINDIIDLLVEQNILNNDLYLFDMLNIDSYLSELLPTRMEYKVESDYYIHFTLNDLSSTTKTTAFGLTYNYPDIVDKNSTKILSSDGYFATNTQWCWYKIPIVMQNIGDNIINSNLTIENINLISENGTIINESIIFYFNGEVTDIDIDSVTYDNTDTMDNATINIKVFIPKFNASSTISENYLFYANNLTIYNDTTHQKNLTLNSLDIITTILDYENSTRGDTLFWTTLNADDEKDMYILYSMNTQDRNVYNKSLIASWMTSDFNITFDENRLKHGKKSFYTSISEKEDIYTITRMLTLKDALVEMKVKVWYL